MHSMGADALLDNILKSLLLFIEVLSPLIPLMRDFYRADQEEESIPSLTNGIEGLLSKIGEKCPEQETFHEN